MSDARIGGAPSNDVGAAVSTTDEPVTNTYFYGVDSTELYVHRTDPAIAQRMLDRVLDLTGR